MAYCINPDCSRRKNPDNCAVCQNCKTPLILQNRYRLTHPLQADRHSYTEVFEIQDLLNPEQPKVLKSLKEVSPELERLFQQEASILTTLQHPGLPVGEAMFPLFLNTGRQLRCFVMEKIPGQDLQAWLSENHYLTSYKIALDWLKQITEILQFVHEQKFFHRDIKPGNIMLRPDGKLMLIDFGTARKLTETIVNGKRVTVIHSMGYTAPEQLDGHAVVQSDFYALGRTLIYLLTGIDPASDRLQNLLHWSKYVKDKKTPKRLIELIQAMTASNLQHRPPTAQVILDKIAQVEKYPQVQWQKFLLTTTCSIFLLFGAKQVYQEITIPRTCDQRLYDHLSCGEESLIPSSFWGNSQPPTAKQLAIEKYRQQNFAEAYGLFQEAFNQEPDAETLIYLNNTKIQIQFTAEQIYTIAVAVPLERRTAIGLEILRGAAQAQTQALQQGQPLRIIIADDSNRQDSKSIIDNNARKIAQHLVKYRDLLAVVGHYSSEATKKSLPIYRQAGLVLISPTSTSHHLNSPFFFRTVPSNAVAAQTMATYVFSQLKQRQAAIFYTQGSEYAESLATEFRASAKSLSGNVINHQAAFNLGSDRFNAKIALNQAQSQGATAIVLIPDAGVGLRDSITKALEVIQSNINQVWVIAGDTLYNPDLLTSYKVISSPGIKRTAWAVAWHPVKDINSPFAQQAKTLWKIDNFPNNKEITWRTATSYDAVLVFSKALQEKPTRLGIRQVLTKSNFYVNGATGVVRFVGSNRQNSTLTIVNIRQNCDAPGVVFTPSDRPLKCQ
ncbi:bifunctional serine/threonine-protein kinase/ABC transporter substrate-binding protein [Anabaena sp. 4-3]|uniref:bifunctional serine/threonine-protein kinase/ABC transporter substrate-binding protein n=1 Tax=Anabaena sp. 4-3 TaxID=1811979 RepID=UPI00082F41F0|nr:bifunctional serine/threonine-protein kinase/ABC transporter substrate-binding protein [Anabaena sp. 4-3]